MYIDSHVIPQHELWLSTYSNPENSKFDDPMPSWRAIRLRHFYKIKSPDNGSLSISELRSNF